MKSILPVIIFILLLVGWIVVVFKAEYHREEQKERTEFIKDSLMLSNARMEVELKMLKDTLKVRYNK